MNFDKFFVITYDPTYVNKIYLTFPLFKVFNTPCIAPISCQSRGMNMMSTPQVRM